jgi:hypothetical protein
MMTRSEDGVEADRPQRSADLRNQQLEALASEGNEEAAADLFKEDGVQVGGEGSQHE